MKINKRLLFVLPLTALVLTGCNLPNANSKESSKQQTPTQAQPVKDDTVSVFVLSGQSNMEGSTYWVHPNGTP